jgi:hypothetical protein
MMKNNINYRLYKMDIEKKGWNWPRIPKNEWGNQGWNWLHLTAINYSQNPSPEDKKIIVDRITKFIYRLPCADCQLHAIKYLRENPINVVNSNELQHWAWRFHNFVNFRLNKPLMSFKDYEQKYFNEICWSHWRC